MLKVEHLNKSFGRFQLKDISFEIPTGYICGMIGENGAGKSTLIRCIMNIYKKDQGDVLLDLAIGETKSLNVKNHENAISPDRISLDQDEAAFKSQVAVVLDQSMYEENMSCLDNARIVESLNPHFQMEQFKKECAFWNLNPKKRLSTLSKGTQMKFQIAMAMAENPKLLIMDEPSANLDEDSRKIFKERLLEFVNDGTRSVLISSHLTKDLEHIADYILYLHKGKVLINQDKESLLDEYLIVSGEKYKIKLLPKELVIEMDEQELTTNAMIKKSNIYTPDIALQTRRPALDDFMYYISLKEKIKAGIGQFEQRKTIVMGGKDHVL